MAEYRQRRSGIRISQLTTGGSASLCAVFGHPDRSETFKEISGSLLAAFNGLPPKDRPESVQVFVLRKIDKGRTKILYSESALADALIHAAENWDMACNDLPDIASIRLSAPFPIDVAAVVNQVWRQDGESSTVSAMHPYEGSGCSSIGHSTGCFCTSCTFSFSMVCRYSSMQVLCCTVEESAAALLSWNRSCPFCPCFCSSAEIERMIIWKLHPT